MKQLPVGKRDERIDKVSVKTTFCGKYRVFAVFLICTAIVVAGFAMSGIWRETETGRLFWERVFPFGATSAAPNTTSPNAPSFETEQPSKADEELPKKEGFPEGAVPVVSLDLSYLSKGEGYCLNETPYDPDVTRMLEGQLDLAIDPDQPQAPLVLIVHTHTVESYANDGILYFNGSVDELTYSNDRNKNMIAVGKTLADHLNARGVPTLHATVMHTGNGMTLQGSYQRAEETIKAYLEQYPSISLVIDLHRDAVLTESGEYVRTALPQDGSLAQVMAVVGTDANGTEHARWEENLALALQLRRMLNAEHAGIARPVYLRNSSYNQELAPYSLLLEIGTGANSLEQAKRTAQEVGDALVKIIGS